MVDPLTKIINLMCGECKVGFSVLFSYRNIKIWVLEDILTEQAVHFKVADP